MTNDPFSSSQIRSLQMIRDFSTKLPEPVVPPGFTIRPFRAGEERAWGRVLSGAGNLGHWDDERIAKAFDAIQKEGIGRVWKESIRFVVTEDDEPIATACIQLHDDEQDRKTHRIEPGHSLPELGWVAVLPEYRTKGLGSAICLSVMHLMLEKGYTQCFLKTNTSRPPAIRTFLKLGFEPFKDDPKYDEDLWKRIMRWISLRLQS